MGGDLFGRLYRLDRFEVAALIASERVRQPLGSREEISATSALGASETARHRIVPVAGDPHDAIAAHIREDTASGLTDPAIGADDGHRSLPFLLVIPTV